MLWPYILIIYIQFMQVDVNVHANIKYVCMCFSLLILKHAGSSPELYGVYC